MAQRTVIVIGAPRSGTSLITGIIEILGVNLGKNLYSEVTAGCPTGSLEDKQLVELNRKILAAAAPLGTMWNPPSLDAIRAKKTEFETEIKSFVEVKRKGCILGLKDPNMILTFDLFAPHIKNPYIIFTKRESNSLAKAIVNYLKKGSPSFEKALMLVRGYESDIKKIKENYASIPSITIDFDKMIRNPITESKKIADFLKLKLTKEKEKKIVKFTIPREKIGKAKRKAAFIHVLQRANRLLSLCARNPWKILQILYETAKNNLHKKG